MTTAVIKFLTPDQIETTVRELLERFGLFDVPVNPVHVADMLEIPVYAADFADDDVSGILKREADGYAIYVNAAHPMNRQRYTVAHELGHYCLHREYAEAFVDPSINLFRTPPASGTPSERRMMETQANMFAAALLMPGDLVKREFEREKRLSILARMFRVSESAMGFRLANLGLA